MKRLFFLPALIGLILSGCTYTVSVSQSNIPAQRKKPVEASIYKFMVMGLNFDNDYALQLATELKERCPGGDVRGVTTHDMVTLYFLGFFWAREVKAQGYCLPHREHADIEAGWEDLAFSRSEEK
jgi:hypothetical protein